MGRAMAHGRTKVTRFSDPTAFPLLSSEAKGRVERALSDAKPESLREGMFRGYLRAQSQMMVARTVVIDDVVRDAKHSQLVILGAGLDGRAWRMPELENVTVFEVDHPDTQKVKRERSSELSPSSKDIRFVPVDFERDRLDDALAKAGHDASKPTTWIWEGVVMYLALPDIEATLDTVKARSAPGSTIVLMYHRPAPFLILARAVLKRWGEPLKSRFQPEEMRRLLTKHGFSVSWDKDVGDIGQELSLTLSRATKHLRFAAATTS